MHGEDREVRKERGDGKEIKEGKAGWWRKGAKGMIEKLEV